MEEEFIFSEQRQKQENLTYNIMSKTEKVLRKAAQAAKEESNRYEPGSIERVTLLNLSKRLNSDANQISKIRDWKPIERVY